METTAEARRRVERSTPTATVGGRVLLIPPVPGPKGPGLRMEQGRQRAQSATGSAETGRPVEQSPMMVLRARSTPVSTVRVLSARVSTVRMRSARVSTVRVRSARVSTESGPPAEPTRLTAATLRRSPLTTAAGRLLLDPPPPAPMTLTMASRSRSQAEPRLTAWTAHSPAPSPRRRPPRCRALRESWTPDAVRWWTRCAARLIGPAATATASRSAR